MRIRGNPASSPENSCSTGIWQWRIDRDSIRYQNCRASDRSSTPSSSSSYSIESCETRCQGLDVLAEAVLHVVQNVLHSEQQQDQEQEESLEGDENSTVMITGVTVFGVPFTKRRVVRRAKKAFRFLKMGDEIGTVDEKKDVKNRSEKEGGVGTIGFGLRSKRSRLQATPTKFQDSVLQPWKSMKRRRLIGQ